MTKSRTRWLMRARSPAPALLVAMLLGGPGALADDAPLQLEDVVRMHVAGLPEERIIERIAGSAVAFDLSEEMLEELRIAGLPEAVIRAMIERQRELDPPTATTAAERAVPAPPRRLTVRFNPGTASDARRRKLRLRDSVGAEASRRLQLEGDRPRITGLAIYVACLSATHVPDHWRGQSALGRDFISMPRHKLLAFHPGAHSTAETAADPSQSPGVLELEIPEALEIELDVEVPHDLSVGIAIRAEDRYYRLTSDTWDGLAPDGEGLVIDAELSSAKSADPQSVSVRLLR